MSKAYLRICAEVGKEKSIRDSLREYDRVLSADVTSGEQDVIALVEDSSLEDILDFTVEEVREHDGIKITWTNPILD